MTDHYTGRARITNKQTGAAREGTVKQHSNSGFIFLEDGSTVDAFHLHADFTIEPILPATPSEPGDTFTAEVTYYGQTERVLVAVDQDRDYYIIPAVGGVRYPTPAHIDRSTIESVITAKERGL